jgi:L-asparaginase/Glu-tRNA(Gln) amidotransferase subunit D
MSTTEMFVSHPRLHFLSTTEMSVWHPRLHFPMLIKL